jgi:hypothetical protein
VRGKKRCPKTALIAESFFLGGTGISAQKTNRSANKIQSFPAFRTKSFRTLDILAPWANKREDKICKASSPIGLFYKHLDL